MKKPWFGFHLPLYTFPGTSSAELFDRVVEQAQAAEANGFGLVTVMDHLYQIGGVGQEDEPMLEGYHLLPSVRGDLLFKLGRFKEARVAYSEALRLDPLSPLFQVGMALPAFFEGDAAGAAKAFAQVTVLAPAFPIAQVMLGLALEQCGGPEEAIQLSEGSDALDKGADRLFITIRSEINWMEPWAGNAQLINSRYWMPPNGSSVAMALPT